MIPRRYLISVVAVAVRLASTSASSATYGFFGGGDSSSRRDDSTTSAASSTITTVVEETLSKEEESSTTTRTRGVSDCIGFGCSELPSSSNSHDEAQEQQQQIGFGSNANNVAGGCTPVALELTTDGRPQDISFELVCNDYTVWTYPSALIPYEGAHGRLMVNACVFLEDKCCHFALHDAHGDGLAEGDFAYMKLKVSEDTVLHYDSMTNPPFTTLAHSFGETCSSSSTSHQSSSSSSSSSFVNITPKDKPQDVDCQMGLERPLNFRIALDEHPEDLSWFLVCSSDNNDDGSEQEMVTVWDQPRGSLAGHVGQVATEKACIPYSSTCSFSIIDSQGDGLTSMHGGDSGGYTLTLGVSMIDAVVNEHFQEKSYCIGKKCNDKTTVQNSDGHLPSSTTTNTEDLQEQKEQFQKELEHLEQEQQQEQAMLEKLQESSENTQDQIDQLEKLEQSLEEEEEQAMQEQQQEEQRAENDQAATEEQDLMRLKQEEEEVLSSLEEEEESFQSWIIAGLGIVAFLLVLVAGTGYYMNKKIKSSRRRSSSSLAKEALSLGRRRSSSGAKEALSSVGGLKTSRSGVLTTITDLTDDSEGEEEEEESSTEPDDTFVLDA